MTRSQAMADAMAYSKLIKAPVYLYKRGESYRSSQLEKLPGWSRIGFAIFGRERVYEDHAFSVRQIAKMHGFAEVPERVQQDSFDRETRR